MHWGKNHFYHFKLWQNAVGSKHFYKQVSKSTHSKVIWTQSQGNITALMLFLFHNKVITCFRCGISLHCAVSAQCTISFSYAMLRIWLINWIQTLSMFGIYCLQSLYFNGLWMQWWLTWIFVCLLAVLQAPERLQRNLIRERNRQERERVEQVMYQLLLLSSSKLALVTVTNNDIS